MGFIGRIPIRNIWLLMFYASDLYRHIEDWNGTVEENPDPLADLVAEILAHRVEQRLRRQLSTGFQPRDANLRRIKGRVDLLRTTRHRLLDQGLVACRFDELSLDTPANRLVLAALETMANTVQNRDLGSRCGSLALRLRRAGVSGKRPTRRQIASVADSRLLRGCFEKGHGAGKGGSGVGFPYLTSGCTPAPPAIPYRGAPCHVNPTPVI